MPGAEFSCPLKKKSICLSPNYISCLHVNFISTLLWSELNNSFGGENYLQIRQQYRAAQYGASSNKNSGINTLFHIQAQRLRSQMLVIVTLCVTSFYIRFFHLRFSLKLLERFFKLHIHLYNAELSLMLFQQRDISLVLN